MAVGTRSLPLAAGASVPDKLLGLFYSTATGAAGTTTGVSNTGANGNMVVAYDKLGLSRPTDEAGSNSNTSNAPVFNGFTDQPLLDEMTTRAIATLSKDGGPLHPHARYHNRWLEEPLNQLGRER